MFNIKILACFALIGIIFISGCADEEKFQFIVFHGGEDFILDNSKELDSLVNRTNDLIDYLDLFKIKKFKILSTVKYSNSQTLTSIYEQERLKKRMYNDTIHVFFWYNSANYNLNSHAITLSSGKFESEKTLLHELIHHRLNDQNKIFPHYSNKEPTCNSKDSVFWCTNLMSQWSIPFSVMLNGKQHHSINERMIDTTDNYYCHERNIYPEDTLYLNYQDTIICCTDLVSRNCNSFIKYASNERVNQNELIELCEVIQDTLVNLYVESSDAFCSRYLSIEVVNSLRSILIEKEYIFTTGDVSNPIQVLIKSGIDKPANISDAEIVKAYVDFYLFELLDNEKIKWHSQKEAEILSEIYNENPNNIYSRNMGIYQKEIIIESNEYYNTNNVNFSLNKNELKFILANYSSFDPLVVKGIMYKGIELHLSTKDIAYLISYLS